MIEHIGMSNSYLFEQTIKVSPKKLGKCVISGGSYDQYVAELYDKITSYFHCKRYKQILE
jgi:hypothetical protein